ncbi:MAG: beta strand repeat-containing protein, partial [Chloroflexota bacterium]
NTAGGPASWDLALSSFTSDGNGTYTITATATDGSGNTATLTRTFIYDAAAPTIDSITAPTAGTKLRAGTLSSLTDITGTASDTGGSSLSSVTVNIQSPNGNFWNNTSHTWTTTNQNAAGGPASWDLALSSFTSDGNGTYTITATATDGSGNTGTLTRTFIYDAAAPTVDSITAPASGTKLRAGTLSTLSDITGTASDTGGSALATVTVNIQSPNGNYWNNTSHTWTTTNENAAGGPASWDLALSSFTADGNGTYTITATATDGSGNTGTLTRTFIYDAAAPTIDSITAPASGTKLRAGTLSTLTHVTGTASDTGGSSLATVTVNIQSPSGNFWNNTNHTWGSTVENTPSGTGSWDLTLSSFSADGNGTYTITATATDGSGNTGTLTRTFIYDAAAPTVDSITAPAAGTKLRAATLSTLTDITGTASDTGGSSLATVTVNIQSPSGNYWNNTSHTWTTTNENAAGGPGSWDLALGSFSADGEGIYTITATATDGSGNTGTLTRTFVYDSVAPAFGTVSFLANGHCDSSLFTSSTTIFYNPAATCANAFDVRAAVTDATSGPASVTFPAIASGSFSHSSETVSGSSPYTSANHYGWTSGATFSSTSTLTAADAAGNTATTDLTITKDSSAPSTSVTCNSLSCSAGYYASSPVSVALTGDDGSGAGVKRIVYTADGSTPAIDGSDSVTNGTVITGASGSLNVSAEGTTTVKWIAEDNVANVSGVSSQAVKIDTVAPAFGTLSFVKNGNCDSSLFASGSTIFYNPASTCANAFDVRAVVTDATSGPQSVAFPAIASGSFAHSAETVNTGGSPYTSANHYGWTSGATFSSTSTLTAADAAGNTTTTNGDITITKDSTKPVTPTSTYPVAGTNYSASGTSVYSQSWSGTTSDAGSGIASASQVQISLQDPNG